MSSDDWKEQLLNVFWRQSVPWSMFRYNLFILIGVGYLVVAIVPQLNGMLGSGDLAETGRIYVGALVLAFLLGAMATDYTRRPLEVRAFMVVVGMLAYGLIVWPAVYWAAEHLSLHRVTPVHYRAAMAMYNTDAGIPFVGVALRCSRLLARLPR